MSSPEFTPAYLHELAQTGDFGTLRQCLDEGADPTACNAQGETLAHSVVQGAWNERAAIMMIERINGIAAPKGCVLGKIHTADGQGRTPASLATQRVWGRLVEVFREDSEYRRLYGQSPDN